MKEIKGNIWTHHSAEIPIVIPTNGYVKDNGENVMGRGLAKQAKARFPKLPKELGRRIRLHGNEVYYFEEFNLLSFPVKSAWWLNADIELIKISAKNLRHYPDLWRWPEVVLPRVGCGAGKLEWAEVKPVLEEYLDDRFVVVDFKSEAGNGH